MRRPRSAESLDRKRKPSGTHETPARTWKEIMDSPSGRLYRAFSTWFLRLLPIVSSVAIAAMFTYELASLHPQDVWEWLLVIAGTAIGWVATVWSIRSAVQKGHESNG